MGRFEYKISFHDIWICWHHKTSSNSFMLCYTELLGRLLHKIMLSSRSMPKNLEPVQYIDHVIFIFLYRFHHSTISVTKSKLLFINSQIRSQPGVSCQGDCRQVPYFFMVLWMLLTHFFAYNLLLVLIKANWGISVIWLKFHLTKGDDVLFYGG